MEKVFCDYLEIDYPLPVPNYIPEKLKAHIYQEMYSSGFFTYDLFCALRNYHITNNGYLYELGTVEFDSDKQPERHRMMHHGYIIAYTYIYPIEDSDTNFILKYKLKFTDGLLVNVELISPNEREINELHRII